MKMLFISNRDINKKSQSLEPALHHGEVVCVIVLQEGIGPLKQ